MNPITWQEVATLLRHPDPSSSGAYQRVMRACTLGLPFVAGRPRLFFADQVVAWLRDQAATVAPPRPMPKANAPRRRRAAGRPSTIAELAARERGR